MKAEFKACSSIYRHQERLFYDAIACQERHYLTTEETQREWRKINKDVFTTRTLFPRGISRIPCHGVEHEEYLKQAACSTTQTQ
jgi:hypothetical protein